MELRLPTIPWELHTLDNGLRVVIHPDRRMPLVGVNLWYHVGSRNESPRRTGFAHLFEHMLFQGSAHVGTNDHFRWVQQVGGVANGSTWYDRTNYYETLPASALELALWLEADRMGWLLPGLTQEKLDTQRDVVLNERRQRVDNQPYGRALERLHELLYPEGHPYRWPVIGYPEHVSAATLEEVRGFFAVHYAPQNAVLTIAGDVDPGTALELAQRYFAEIPRGPERPAPVPPAAVAGAPERDVLPDRVQLDRVYIGAVLPRYGSREWYAGSLLAVALSGGKSSPLYEDLVYRRQLAKDVSVAIFPTELAATFLVVATGRPGVSAATLEQALAQHLERAATAPLPTDELERARHRVLHASFGALETLENKADLLSQMTTYFDDPARVTTEIATYAELDAGELQRLAATALAPERRSTLAVVPLAVPA